MARSGWLIGYTAKTRPCLVLSTTADEADRALVTVVPPTTSTRGSRFEVSTPARFLKEGAFDAQNLVTISRAKFLRKLGTLSADQLATIENALRLRLGL